MDFCSWRESTPNLLNPFIFAQVAEFFLNFCVSKKFRTAATVAFSIFCGLSAKNVKGNVRVYCCIFLFFVLSKAKSNTLNFCESSLTNTAVLVAFAAFFAGGLYNPLAEERGLPVCKTALRFCEVGVTPARTFCESKGVRIAFNSLCFFIFVISVKKMFFKFFNCFKHKNRAT